MSKKLATLAALLLSVSVLASACGHSGGGGSSGAVSPTTTTTSTSTSDPHLVYALGVINNARAAHGAGPLSLDSGLDATGLRHAQDLMTCSASSSFSACAHADFKAGDTGGALAENQAVWGPGDEDANFLAAFNAMMAEGPPPPGQVNHYSNLMNPSFTLVGIGEIQDSTQTLWLSEEFK